MFLIKTEQNSTGQDYRKIYIYADSNFVNSEGKIIFYLNKKEEVFDGANWVEFKEAFKKHFLTIEINNSQKVFLSDGVKPDIVTTIHNIVDTLPTTTETDLGNVVLNTTDGKLYICESNIAEDESVTYTWSEFVSTTELTDSSAAIYNDTYYRYSTTDSKFIEAQVIGQRDYLMSFKFNQIGGSSVDDYVYQIMASYIDQYLYENYTDLISNTLGL